MNRTCCAIVNVSLGWFNDLLRQSVLSPVLSNNLLTARVFVRSYYIRCVVFTKLLIRDVLQMLHVYIIKNAYIYAQCLTSSL